MVQRGRDAHATVGILWYTSLMQYRIPYAIGSFEELIEGGYYFVDKTGYLRQLEQYKVPVFLRPRRFGKRLWCSLLECYYDVNRGIKFDALFGRLAIGRWLDMQAPLPADVEQVTRYAEDIRREFPTFTVRRYLIYIVGRKGFRVFGLDDGEYCE